MGSCVSQCSRETIHQQTVRASGEVASILGPQTDEQGGHLNEGADSLKGGSAEHSSDGHPPGSNAPDTWVQDATNVESQTNMDLPLREQIIVELKALRSQIAQSQVALSYLSGGYKFPPGHFFHSGCYRQQQSWECLEEDHPISFQNSGLYSKQASFERSDSSTTSRKSTPIHKLHLAQSCPVLPVETSAVTKATQTEPIDSVDNFEPCEVGRVSSTLPRCTTGGLTKFNTITIDNMCPSVIMPSSSTKVNSAVLFQDTKQTTFLKVPNSDIQNSIVREEDSPLSPYFPRNRSLSFVTAIRQGNPNLIDARENYSNNVFNKNQRPFYNIPPPGTENHPHPHSDIHFHSHYYHTPSLNTLPNIEANQQLYMHKQDHNHQICGGRKEIVQSMSTPIVSLGSSSMKQAFVSNENIPQQENISEKLKEKKEKNDVPVNRKRSQRGSIGSQNSGITRCLAFDFSEDDDGEPSTSVLQAVNEQKKKEVTKDKLPLPVHKENVASSKEIKGKLGAVNTKGITEPEVKSFVTQAEVLPSASNDSVFPSLPDSMLSKLEILKSSIPNFENLTGKEIESKFKILSKAFYEDQRSLPKRIEYQQWQREMSEKNVVNKLKIINDSLNSVIHNCKDLEVYNRINKVKQTLDIIQHATSRMSGRAEMFGAFLQEERMRHAFEIMMMHVESLKRQHDKEHSELEETRRLLIEHSVLREEGSSTTLKSEKRIHCSIGSSGGSVKSHSKKPQVVVK